MADEMVRLTELVATAPKPGWDWIWDAFWRLDTERPWKVQGVGSMAGTIIMAIPGAIPWTAIARWCDAHERTPEDRDLLEVCVRKMEAIYLPWWIERHRPRR